MDADDFGEQGGEEEEVVDELDPNDPDYHFLLLEREFARTIGEIEQNPETAQYADEYNKLFETLYTVHQNEKECSSKAKYLQEHLTEAENKLEIAKKITEADSQTIAELRGQIEHAWRMADAAHEREQAAQEMIEMLRKQAAAVQAELDFKNKMGQDSSEDMGQANKQKEGLIREKEKLTLEVQKLTDKLASAVAYQEELERLHSAADLKITDMSVTLEEQAMEIDRQKRVREKLDQDMEEMKDSVDRAETELIATTENLQAMTRHAKKMETQMTESKQTTEKYAKELESLHNKYARLQDDFGHLKYTNETIRVEFNKLTNDMRLKEEAMGRQNLEIVKLGKTKDHYLRKLALGEREKKDMIEERDKLRHTIHGLEKELDKELAVIEEDKRQMEFMTREKDILNKNVLRHQALTRDHVKLLKLQQQTKKKLELEIESYQIERGKQAKQVSYLEKEKDRLLEEELDLTKKIEDTMEDVRLKKTEIYELKKTVAENESRLRMQQNLFDVMRAEKNALQKSLTESSAECTELRAKLKLSNHQTEQLKEDIAMREKDLIKEEIILRKVMKEKENLRLDLNNTLDLVRDLKQELGEMKAEERRLHKVIAMSDKQIRQQAKDLEQLMNERDVLGAQLVRRNDELSLLYEKIRILQTTLQRGEAQYDQRLEDIRILKMEIRRLRQEKNLLTRSINNMSDLRMEVFHLERDLTTERLKCRALEDELQSPLNIHRWRKLEGSDPEALEMLQKIQLLQKRLLQQASVMIEKERQLKESERLYLNLRQVVAKQPGPEIQTRMVKTQKALSDKIKKIKVLVSELNMTELKVAELKQELANANEEHNATKLRLIEEKKKNEMLRTTSTVFRDARSSSKILGGGFNMTSNAVN